MRRILIAIALCSFAVPALAEEPADTEANPALEEARSFLKGYLDELVKARAGRKPKPAEVAKKLRATKKQVHPKTLELIADQEKKQVVTNALAVWHWAKADYWLEEYEITGAKEAAMGTVVVETQEKSWRVEEQGVDADPELAAYLLYKQDGKWLIIDKRRNSTFTADAIKIGYKNHFPTPKAEPKQEAQEAVGETAEE